MEKAIAELRSLIKSVNEDNIPDRIAQIQNKLKEVDSLKNSSPENEANFQAIFSTEILELTHQCYFLKYIYDKPRGYAGDFMTQEMIWKGRTDFELYFKDMGDFERITCQMSLAMEACQATEIRVKYLKNVLQSYRGKRIASLACGSCIEFWDIDESYLQETDIFCLDQDTGALQSAKENIKNLSDSIVFQEGDVVKFMLSDKVDFGKRDLIYMYGLFDYFALKSTKRLIRKTWNSIAPGGEIIFTNAHPDTPTRLWMKYIGEWNLDYKTKEELMSIPDGIEGVKNVDYFMDELNVYQYMRIQRE